jgi:ATP-dependent helicase HrpB
LARWRDSGGDESGILNESACRRVAATSRQLRLKGGRAGGDAAARVTPGELLAYAYPDRIARRREGGYARYLMASGRAVTLAEDDPLAGSDYLVIAALDAGKREGRAYLSAPIDIKQIRARHQTRIKCVSGIKWDSSSCSVVAERREMLGAVTLSTQPLAEPDPESVSSAMLEGVRMLGLDSLPWGREAKDLRDRVRALRRWRPDEGWPDLSDEALLSSIESWLAPWLSGMTRQKQLQQLDLVNVLTGMLGWTNLKKLNELVPTHIEVPSGSRKRLEYTAEGVPVLKVRLQEMFGLQRTPCICNGEVAVMLHLLSPAQRPVQVTRDLEGFWRRTYGEVRKELKGRYPKHYWPEDPSQAEATNRVRPKQKGRD